MALSQWTNPEFWDSLRDKFNAIVILLKGGGVGKVLTGTGPSTDPEWQDIGTAVLPPQEDHEDEALFTNGETAEWRPIPVPSVDRQTISGDPNMLYPIAGQQTTGTVIGSLEATSGPNRGYLLFATTVFNRETSSPETIWCFFKNGISFSEFKSVAIPTNGQTQTVSFHDYDPDGEPGDVYQFRVKADGNQVRQRKFTFTIDGYPV